jgi:hypothetical protein
VRDVRRKRDALRPTIDAGQNTAVRQSSNHDPGRADHQCSV